jgi:rhodanese-related sulfurtransferase
MTATLEKGLTAAEYFQAKLNYEMTLYTLNTMLAAKNADVLALDVRDAAQYAECHIAGALNVPLADLPAKMATLPKDKTIVTYCGSLTCGLAPKAALQLAQKGFKVMQLMGGMTEWNAKGFPVEKKA